jgi:NTP pyrophosphatase (non-canonical NTP hydrolase)
MTFNSYKSEAIRTVVYPRQYAIAYPALKLMGELGELLEACNDGHWDNIKKECGDCCWYLAALCSDSGISIDIHLLNFPRGPVDLEKLRDRANRNVLQGSGDNR